MQWHLTPDKLIAKVRESVDSEEIVIDGAVAAQGLMFACSEILHNWKMYLQNKEIEKDSFCMLVVV